MSKIKFEWDEISDSMTQTIDRAKVEGGWIVRYIEHWGITIEGVRMPMKSVSTTFIPDKNHKWGFE